MKKLLAATVLAAALASPALSADLPARVYTKAPAMVSAAYNWTGFYIGINGGGGSAHKCWDITVNGNTPVVPALPQGCHNATGGTVGGQLGYRWQASSWVFGLEAQGNWADFTGSNQNLFTTAAGFPQIHDRTRIRDFGMFTGQVGYAMNNTLLYVKGGAAVVDDRYENFTTNAAFGPAPANTVFATAKEVRWGAVVGGGLEFGFAPNWSAAVEYDHMFLGTKSATLVWLPQFNLGTANVSSIRQDVDMVTARVNYHFGGPVVAKY